MAAPSLFDLVDPSRPNGQDWDGAARMAAARQAAGLPLNEQDRQALRIAGLDVVVDPTVPPGEARLVAGGRTVGLITGIARRDDALNRVEEHADPTWLDRAKAAIRLIAAQQETLTGDDLWRHVEKPAEPRAAGAVFRWARAEGLIAPTDRFVPTTQATAHASPSRVWRSLLAGEE